MNSAGATPVLVRVATDADLAAVTAIYAHQVTTGTASFELTAPDLGEIARRFRDITLRGLPYLVAQFSVGEPRIAGYAYASPYRPRPGYRYTVEDSVYVDPQCAGRGVGRALLEAVIVASEALGCRQMLAVIGGADNHASIRLHASLGFEHVGRLTGVGRKFDRWLDSILMQRQLGAGAGTPAD